MLTARWNQDACARAAWAESGGGVEQALSVLEMMREDDVNPNTISYTTLINAARHQGTDSSVCVSAQTLSVSLHV